MDNGLGGQWDPSISKSQSDTNESQENEYHKTMDAFQNGTGDVCREMTETKDRDLR